MSSDDLSMHERWRCASRGHRRPKKLGEHSHLRIWVSIEAVEASKILKHAFLHFYTFHSNTMLRLSFLLTADTHCGRFDPSLLTDQQRLELMVAKLSNDSKARMEDLDGTFLDIRWWMFVRCNNDGLATALIKTRLTLLSGSIDFAWLPPNITMVQLQDTDIHGTLDTGAFPTKLNLFDIAGGGLTGTVDLTGLPQSLTSMNIADHAFEGTVDLTGLPLGMRVLCLAKNSFAGAVDISRLPDSMQILDLQQNAFSGEIAFDSLPEEMYSLYLQGNFFAGEFVVRSLPRDMYLLNASRNSFQGTGIVHRAASRCVQIDACNFEAVVDENGSEYNADHFKDVECMYDDNQK